MNFFGNKYYRLHRRLLLMVGLWPYDESIVKYVQKVLCNIIVGYTVIAQIRGLIDHVEKDWNMLKDKMEMEILGRYTYFGSIITSLVAIFIYFIGVVMSFVPFLPIVLDILAPLNVSRPRHLMFPCEFFVDHQKYFYVITLHVSISIFLMFTTLIGTETLFVTHVLHACGMFRVASYRFDQAFGNKLWQAYPVESRALIVYKKLIEAMLIHKRALEYITQWYSAPVQAQKLLPIIMQRSTRSCKMAVGGGMYIPSFEGFATLMSMTVSYFTVLCSVRE
ncbi:uncharacterized protein LOC109858667 [Pseudomyrmex gracilis]|uniref:uncharacterized protein LOC109858667 n=1 Tax=Pseudomyrmex gracilis TaxID=219809 RepID=UPI000995320A|nr:uncharacterized protein LOC109858667 [Pseudomyrmex gracilis]